MKTTEKSASNLAKPSISLDRRVCVAPMMDYTDRHCRYFLRLLTPGALLYTEMITAAALVRGDADRLLAFDAAEHPVALQLGGSDPSELAQAARLGAAYGYDEINLNCGCPSDRVRSGRFGACLMAEPTLVAECVQAMREAVNLPVTVKCRIAIQPLPPGVSDDYELLCRFVAEVAAAGCKVFVVHARRAVLGGLSPKQNREIPPLQYPLVQRLQLQFPELQLVLNGGVRSVDEARQHLTAFDGVMLGREAYHNPYLLALLHRELVAPDWPLPLREEVIERYAAYAHVRVGEGHRLRGMVRHVLGLYAGLPGVRSWRRLLLERCNDAAANADLLLDALRIVRNAA
jgi:tRNA-dihydrouridine synthase A